MPVPPLDGVKDGLVYHISNLSMEGFKVRKEDIQIELAGIRATKKASVSVAPQAEASGDGGFSAAGTNEPPGLPPPRGTRTG